MKALKLLLLLTFFYQTVSGQVKYKEDYIIVHPNWTVGDSVLFDGEIIMEGIENGDSIHSNIDVAFTLVVMDIDENGDYLLKCHTDPATFFSDFPELDLIDDEINQFSIPPILLSMDKWGYPKSIVNIEAQEVEFTAFFNRILSLYDGKSEPEQLEEARQYIESQKGDQLEKQLLQSFSGVFGFYDQINKYEIDEETNADTTIYNQNHELIEEGEFLRIVRNLTYNYPKTEALDGTSQAAYKSNEAYTFLIHKESGWLSKMLIQIDRRQDGDALNMEISYAVKMLE